MKWLIPVAVLFLASCSPTQPEQAQVSYPKIELAKYEGLYRSVKAIETAVVVAVTRDKFRELVQNAGTELAIAKDRAKSQSEIELVNQYGSALNTYLGSLKLWDAQLADYTFDEGIRCVGTIESVLKAYDLPCVPWRSGDNIVPKASIQYLWTVAEMDASKAHARLLADGHLVKHADLNQMKEQVYAPILAMSKAIQEREALLLARNKEREASLSARNRRWKQDIEEYARLIGHAPREGMREQMVAVADGYYHELTCDRVSIPRKLVSLGEALARGYKPCVLCKPPIVMP